MIRQRSGIIEKYKQCNEIIEQCNDIMGHSLEASLLRPNPWRERQELGGFRVLGFWILNGKLQDEEKVWVPSLADYK